MSVLRTPVGLALVGIVIGGVTVGAIAVVKVLDGILKECRWGS